MSDRIEIRALSTLIREGADGAIPEDIQWMPPGSHNIRPHVEGRDPETFSVIVDAKAAKRVVESLNEARKDNTAGVYIDFNHNTDLGAAGWIESMYWGGDDPATGGIRAKIKWTDDGLAALKAKKFKSFSPRFFLDEQEKHIVATGANAGGLVNEPAFTKITPIVAKKGEEGGDDTNKPKPQEGMTDEEKKEIDALKAEIADLKKKNSDLERGNKEANAKLAEVAEEKKKDAEAKAAKLLESAIEAGAIEPKNEDKKKEFLAMATDHPNTALTLIEAAKNSKSALGQRTTPTGDAGNASGSGDDDLAEFKCAQAYMAKHNVDYQTAWNATRTQRQAITASASA